MSRSPHVLVMAKSPLPGRVKTRLCPPLSAEGAAAVATAALADTLEAVAASGAGRRILALDGPPGPWLAPGFEVIAQRGRSFNERLAAAWDDAGGPGLQLGMDTPQVDAGLIDACLAATVDPAADACLGPADDGGWWAVGFATRPPAGVFDDVTMSTSTTGKAQRDRLRALGLRVRELPALRDVDDAADADAVAAAAPDSRFAAAWLQRRAGDTAPLQPRPEHTAPLQSRPDGTALLQRRSGAAS